MLDAMSGKISTRTGETMTKRHKTLFNATQDLFSLANKMTACVNGNFMSPQDEANLRRLNLQLEKYILQIHEGLRR